MEKLYVSIEINGVQTHVGTISGNTIYDAEFTYDEKYIEENMPAISVSLPVSGKSFKPEATKFFLKGFSFVVRHIKCAGQQHSFKIESLEKHLLSA